jgi:hypothetical protein
MSTKSTKSTKSTQPKQPTQVTLTIEEINSLDVGDFLQDTKTEPKKEYICQNQECVCDGEIKNIHLFEISEDDNIVICEQCYDAGYRFCLFTHQVIHQNGMVPVLKDQFALKEYDKGQLHPDHLCQIDDMFQYFKMIGIDNPDPEHTIIDLERLNEKN